MDNKLPSTTTFKKSHFCKEQAHVVEQPHVVQDLADFTGQCTGEIDITEPVLSPVPEQAVFTSPRLFPRTIPLFSTRRILSCLNMDWHILSMGWHKQYFNQKYALFFLAHNLCSFLCSPKRSFWNANSYSPQHESSFPFLRSLGHTLNLTKQGLEQPDQSELYFKWQLEQMMSRSPLKYRLLFDCNNFTNWTVVWHLENLTNIYEYCMKTLHAGA